MTAGFGGVSGPASPQPATAIHADAWVPLDGSGTRTAHRSGRDVGHPTGGRPIPVASDPSGSRRMVLRDTAHCGSVSNDANPEKTSNGPEGSFNVRLLIGALAATEDAFRDTEGDRLTPDVRRQRARIRRDQAEIIAALRLRTAVRSANARR